MSIDSASQFILNVMRDANIRSQINGCSDSSELNETLLKNSYIFNFSEFDDAYRILLLRCPDEESANALKEFRLWWELASSAMK